MKCINGIPRSALWPLGVLALFSVLFGLLNYTTPRVEEDMEYGVTGFLLHHGLSDDMNLQGMWNHIVHLYQDCNGRTIDKLPVPVLVLMPRWLIVLKNIGALWLLFAAACKLMAVATGGVWRNKPLRCSWLGFAATYPWLASAFVVLMSMFFPWNGTMMLESYLLGYLWTSVIVLWTTYLFVNRNLIGECSAWVYMLMVFVMVVAGTCHELIPCVLCCAFIVPTLFSGSKKLFMRRAIIVIALFTGYMILSHTPGHLRRVGYTVIEFNWQYIRQRYHGLVPTTPVMPVAIFILTLAVWIVCSLKNFKPLTVWQYVKSGLWPIRLRSDRWTLIVTMLGGAVASVAVYGFFGASRIMCYGILMSMIGGLSLLAIWPGGIPRLFALLLKFVVVSLAVCSIAVWTVSIIFERRVFRINEILEHTLFSSPGKDTIFVDSPNVWYSDFVDRFSTWKPVIYSHYILKYPIYNPFNRVETVSLVPEVFAHMETDAMYSDIVKMQSPPDGYQWVDRNLGVLRFHDRYLFTNPDCLPMEVKVDDPRHAFGGLTKLRFDAEFSDGATEKVWSDIIPFTTPRSGQRAYWIKYAIISKKTATERIVSVPDEDTFVFTPPRIINIDSSSFGYFELFPNEPLKYRVGSEL